MWATLNNEILWIIENNDVALNLRIPELHESKQKSGKHGAKRIN